MERNPGVTEAYFRKHELKVNSNLKERQFVWNLTIGDSVLLDYIQDKIANEGFEDRLVPVHADNFYKIPKEEATSFIKLWKMDQSRDLTLEHLYNMTVRPYRGSRSPKDSPSFHEDSFQDKIEIMSKMPDYNMGDPAEEKIFYEKMIRKKPITLYTTIRVELLPNSHGK